MTENVELVTIYLVDLVGSTHLASTLGPVRFDTVRDEYFALLREAITSSGGREFKNTGDGLSAAFSSASAAIECAVLTQQLLARRHRGKAVELHVRIGLGTGESTVQGGEYFGMPAVEAARLCDKAPTDGILVSPATRLLATRIDGAMFESVGALELKGLPEPLEAFAVLWQPLGGEAAAALDGWPLPAALRTPPARPYVGRLAERERLERSRAAARAGARQLLFLSGEPGIGKTRLASHQARAAHLDGFAVCWGACSEDLAAPYEPWIELCSHLVEHVPEELLVAHVQRFGGELSRLARNLPRRLADVPAPQASDPETERYLLFAAVSGFLAAVAAAVPVCLVLDDAHWADSQSVALLKHVAHTVEHAALQVLVTFRDSDLPKEHPLAAALADLRRDDGVQRIALPGLGIDEVAEMVADAAGQELTPDGLRLAYEITAETGGNAFFVREILLNLSESGVVQRDEPTGRWRIDRSSGIGLPASVREVVERRVEQLGQPAREALALAAVIGRSFDIDVLVRLVDLSEGQLLDQLDAAVAALLLEESTEHVGRFTFAHALINHTLYESLGRTRRARTHQRVAETLEELYGTESSERFAELALHWRLAARSDTSKAARYALLAGQRALEGLGADQAARLFGDALELIGDRDPVARCEALIGLGESQRLIGDRSFREALLEASAIASGLEHAELAARAALCNSRGMTSAIGAVDRDRVAAIKRAIDLDVPMNPARRSRLLALQAQELWYDADHEHRHRLALQALALARDVGEPATLAEVLRNVFFALWAPETLSLRAQLADELSSTAAVTQDPALRFWAANAQLNVSVSLGAFDRARAALTQQELIAAELGQPTLRWISTFTRAGFEWMNGDLNRAELELERAMRIGMEAGEPDAVMIFGANLLLTRLYQGRGEEIVATMEQNVAKFTLIPAWRAGLSRLYCWIGRRADAAALVEDAAARRFEDVPHDATRITALIGFSEAAAATGVTDAAAILYDALAPHRDEIVWNGVSCYGHVGMYLGLLAAALSHHEQADEHFAIACEFHETNGIHLWAARTHLGWAEALAARGDCARAREPATRARELSLRYGFGAFESRAAAIAAPEAKSPAS